jgi:1-acyl-sn-glycerol-3-phosphate acyltransferase
VIPARKNASFSTVFAWETARRLRASFGELRTRGLSELAAVAREDPVIVVSNHVAWWDPLVIFHLVHGQLGLDGYSMMDAKNLRKLPFFSRIGAFGVDLEDPADGAHAIRYAAKLLDRPGRLVWIFPQGRERPVTARPLQFRIGAAAVARVAKRARVFAAGLRYEHGSSPAPSLLVSLAGPLAVPRDVREATAEQEAAVTRELDVIDDALCKEQLARFSAHPLRGPSQAFAFAQRALGWLVGGAATDESEPGG